MGGTLAQILAARGLASGAVLLATAHCAPIVAFTPSAIHYIAKELLFTPFWRQAQLPSYRLMRQAGLNGLSERDARNLYATLIPESGRALYEIALWYFDKRRASLVDAENITCPLLMLTGTDDRLTPLSVVRRTAAYYGDKATLETLNGHAHWLPVEPGWQEIAARAAHFIKVEAALIDMKTGAAEAAPVLETQPA
jgi:pimeloyl-ACP methyl ester carboxylesterase